MFVKKTVLESVKNNGKCHRKTALLSATLSNDLFYQVITTEYITAVCLAEEAIQLLHKRVS